MILAADAGNTRVKISVADAKTAKPLFTVPTCRLTAEPGFLSDALVRCRDLPPVLEGAVYCSVVPAANRSIAAALRRVTGVSPVVVTSESDLPFRLRVLRPSNVGSDRLAAAAGAVGRGRRSVIVVDVGTAITVDLVADGEFRGGLIMVGPALALEALGTYARRLPRIGTEALYRRRVDLWNDTEPAMVTGARAAGAGAVIEAVRMLRRGAGSSPGVVVTGGGMEIIALRLPRSWRRDPFLVARGLHRLWELNRGGAKKNP